MTIDGGSLLQFFNFALPIAVGIYSWIVSQNKAAEHDIRGIEGRIAKLEGELTHMPDKDTVHTIQLGMGELKARIDAQAEVIKAVKSTMERVEAFLLDAQMQKPVTAARRGK